MRTPTCPHTDLRSGILCGFLFVTGSPPPTSQCNGNPFHFNAYVLLFETIKTTSKETLQGQGPQLEGHSPPHFLNPTGLSLQRAGRTSGGRADSPRGSALAQSRCWRVSGVRRALAVPCAVHPASRPEGSTLRIFVFH